MEDKDWSPPHAHDPNPEPPSADATVALHLPGREIMFTPEDLRAMPQSTVSDCYIVSTGHGTSGPFAFTGVALKDILNRYGMGWSAADIISADGFRARVTTTELAAESIRPVMLALAVNGRPMSRGEGLVRLIVPGETDDALRQVKWVRDIRLVK